VNKSQRVNAFLGKCLKTLIKNEVTAEFINQRNIDCGGLAVSGYFDETERVIRIGAKRSDWFPLFLHEYCHFCQWKEGKFTDLDDIEDLDDWYKPDCLYDYETAEQLTRLYQKVELDCEKRVVRLIRKHKLPIDVEDYIRQANAYVYLYNLALEKKQWIGKGPSGSKKLKGLSPPTFQRDYRVCPADFRKYALRYCFPKDK